MATRGKSERHIGHKKVMLSVSHGAPVPEIALEEERERLNSLCKEALGPSGKLHKRFTEKGNRPWPENSTFAYWWQILEDCVLRALVEEVVTARQDHLSFALRVHGSSLHGGRRNS